jgi:formate dehydrogenase
MPVVPTWCRVCESACGLLATVEGDRVVDLAPDPEHPLSQGYACRKGLRYADVHHHPARVRRPLLRRDGALVEASWDEALADVGGRIRAIRDRHGPESVGLFLGNATVYGLGAILGTNALQGALGSTKTYSSLSLDNACQFPVLESCLGNPMATFLADYGGSDCIVLFGTDPLSSQPSQAQSHPGGVRELLRRAADGALIAVDPRTSATARKASLHLQPRPGSDVALLAWLVREAVARGRWRGDALLDPADVEALGRAVEGFDRGRAAAATGLGEDALQELADRLLGAERPLVWSGLGVLLGPDGTLAYWLTLALQASLGGLDRPGGWAHHRGAVDVPWLFRQLRVPGRDPKVRSRIGGYPAILGTVAAATLADDVLTPGDGQLRALIVVGGNPALSLPDTARAQAALRSLELLVTVDLFVSDTGTLAHAVLPAADWLERADLDLHMSSQRRRPHLQVGTAVVPPVGEVRTDWEIALGLARAAGLPAFGSRLADAAVRCGLGPRHLARLAVGAMAPFSWAELVASPRGRLGGADHGVLRAKGTFRRDGRVRLADPELIAALATVSPPDDGLRLVTSVRPVETMNSWMHDLKGSTKRVPVASLHPDELAARGLADGATIRLARPGADVVVEVVAKADPGVRRGVVVLPYGWGHLPGAVGGGDGGAGVSANALVGTERLEAFSGQPVSNGQRVDVVGG